MDEAIRNPVVTSRHDGPAAVVDVQGEVFTRRVITVVLSLITALTFAFGFGNVWALGRSLGVPALVAPLVGPAVDLSVAGLLIGIRHLSMSGVPREQLRPARILLGVCGVATLALNIAEPVAAGAFGRAAFDSVGPGLLIGWAETGPAMLRFLYARPRDLEAPHADEAPAQADPDTASDLSQSRVGQARTARAPRLDELLDEARQIDDEHRLWHRRPVSAETLRKQMRIGSMRARALVQMVRDSRERATNGSEALDHASSDQTCDGQFHAAYADENPQWQAPDLASELGVLASQRDGTASCHARSVRDRDAYQIRPATAPSETIQEHPLPI